MIETAKALEGVAQFLRSVAEGGFKPDTRAGWLVASNSKLLQKLERNYEDLLEALEAKGRTSRTSRRMGWSGGGANWRLRSGGRQR